MKYDKSITPTSKTEGELAPQPLPKVEDEELNSIRKQAADYTFAIGAKVQAAKREGIADGEARLLKEEMPKTAATFREFIDRVTQF